MSYILIIVIIIVVSPTLEKQAVQGLQGWDQRSGSMWFGAEVVYSLSCTGPTEAAKAGFYKTCTRTPRGCKNCKRL